MEIMLVLIAPYPTFFYDKNEGYQEFEGVGVDVPNICSPDAQRVKLSLVPCTHAALVHRGLNLALFPTLMQPRCQRVKLSLVPCTHAALVHRGLNLASFPALMQPWCTEG